MYYIIYYKGFANPNTTTNPTDDPTVPRDEHVETMADNGRPVRARNQRERIQAEIAETAQPRVRSQSDFEAHDQDENQ